MKALLGHSKVSSADLLDVYTELVEASSELDIMASNSILYGDLKLAPDLENLSQRAALIGVNLSITLRSQIAAQESQLGSCTQKTRRATRNHPSQ